MKNRKSTIKKVTLYLLAVVMVTSIAVCEFLPGDFFAPDTEDPVIAEPPPPPPTTEPQPPPTEPPPTTESPPATEPPPVTEDPSEPEPEPPPHPATLFFPGAVEGTDPMNTAFRYDYDIMVNGEIVSDYTRSDPIDFGMDHEYTNVQGVTTFRGNNFRSSAAWGNVNVRNETLTTKWQINIDGLQGWTGAGWTGQPVIVRWRNDIRQIMNIYPEKKAKEDLVEVIYGTMDGIIRFLDLDDGKPTRAPINTFSPIKGAVMIDPRGLPLLYVGQGVFTGHPLGHRIYSLIDYEVLHFTNGLDSFRYRTWRSFDGNPLVCAASDTMVLPGENGILYTVKLNTRFNIRAGTISLDPEVVKFRYKTPLSRVLGIESSVVGFSHYAFFTDNSGLVSCVDLNTMTPVWIQHCTDDTDSTPLFDIEEDGGFSLYTACEVDLRNRADLAYIRKLNAITGEILWEHSYRCAFDDHVNGGVLASPILGKGDIDGGIIFFVAKTITGKGGGVLVNLDKATGEVIWETWFRSYGWSSPVDVYTESGKSYIIVCDASGNVHLVEGRTGKVLRSINIRGNVEASPAIFENKIVVGTRAQVIFCIEIG